MKRIFVTIMLLAAVAVGPVLATGYGRIRGTVPFEFMVGSKTLPAGEYDFVDSTQFSIHVRTVDGKTNAFAITPTTDLTYQGKDAQLTFEIVDGKYHLVNVARPGSAKDVNRPSSSATGVLAYVKAVLR